MLRKKTVLWTVFADVATSVSEAIGAVRRKIPITCSKTAQIPFGICVIFFTYGNRTRKSVNDFLVFVLEIYLYIIYII